MQKINPSKLTHYELFSPKNSFFYMKKLLFGVFTTLLISCNAQEEHSANQVIENTNDKVILSEKDWKEKLTEEEFRVLRESGTERAFTGKFNKHYENGTYLCAGCGNPLFKSDTKYDSGSGWPAFYDSIDKTKVREIKDTSHGMRRLEVRCARCDGHLGHVFEDGPRDKTGLRYCINSVSLNFKKEK